MGNNTPERRRTAKYLVVEFSERNIKTCLKAKVRDIRRWAIEKGYEPCSASFEELRYSFTDTCHCCGLVVGYDKIRLDHCHKTGRFRGWICFGCNMVMGYVDKNSLLLDALKVYSENTLLVIPPEHRLSILRAISLIGNEVGLAEALTLIANDWWEMKNATTAG